MMRTVCLQILTSSVTLSTYNDDGTGVAICSAFLINLKKILLELVVSNYCGRSSFCAWLLKEAPRQRPEM